LSYRGISIQTLVYKRTYQKSTLIYNL